MQTVMEVVSLTSEGSIYDVVTLSRNVEDVSTFMASCKKKKCAANIFSYPGKYSRMLRTKKPFGIVKVSL